MTYSLIETFKHIVSEATRFKRVDFGGYDIYMQTTDGRTITAHSERTHALVTTSA
ncbi:hypothetical protein ACV3PA_09385 [Exiguobacterium acetylicum]